MRETIWLVECLPASSPPFAVAAFRSRGAAVRRVARIRKTFPPDTAWRRYRRDPRNDWASWVSPACTVVLRPLELYP
jgi:hypothetical protein